MSLAAPPVVYVPPSAGSPPAAAGAVFVPPSAGSPPAAAGAVFVPQTSVGGVAATGILDFAGQAVADETVTIGGTVYTFVASSASAGEVTIGVDPVASIFNLIAEINGEGIGPAHESVTAATGESAGSMEVTAIVPGTGGNAIGTTETMTNGSWAAATLTGGAVLAPPPAITT